MPARCAVGFPPMLSTLCPPVFQVPPDLGLGPDNAGISAARLLFFLPPRVALSLIAALLMERRIILVASAEDKVSAAVHAAAALLHPFRWQHIYLPLLPLSLKVWCVAGPARMCLCA